jgi:hypothetical protein
MTRTTCDPIITVRPLNPASSENQHCAAGASACVSSSRGGHIQARLRTVPCEFGTKPTCGRSPRISVIRVNGRSSDTSGGQSLRHPEQTFTGFPIDERLRL